MGFISDLFNWSPETDEETLSLGRYSDAYKPTASYETWEKSLLAFESEDYLDSFEMFLNFLKSPKQENISYTRSDDQIEYKFYQGSKEITGFCNNEKFKATAKIAVADQLNIGLMRRLLDRNYLLKYSRFALDDENHIVMHFDSYTSDASPNKLYQGLKEIATQADKLDDIIIGEFRSLQAINNSHIIERSEVLKERQYLFLQHKLEACFNEIENGKLNTDQFPGGLSYLLLDLNYKIDYLLKPEGFLMDTVEHNHRTFFANDGKEVSHKNKQFIDSFREILNKEKEEIKAELYDVISTFGLAKPSTHENLVSFIDTELPNMEWYKENNHTAIALAIPSYIAGYCLFNFALPLPDMKLLQLFYKITEPEIFYASVTESKFRNKDKINARVIKKEIENVNEKYLSVYPHLKIDSSILKFESLVEFAESYIRMIRELNLNRT